MNLENPVAPAVLLNILIVAIIAGLVLYLKEPLGILALFLLVPIPQLEYREYEEQGENIEAVGNTLPGEYNSNGMGFNGKLRK